MIRYALAAELMKRRKAGRTASAAELEREVSALIAAKPAAGFKWFMAESTKDILEGTQYGWRGRGINETGSGWHQRPIPARYF